MLGSNGSRTKYLVAMSSTNYSTEPASTNASNFAGYELGTLFVLASSAPSGGGFTANMLRSGTSDGTFANFGASINFNTKNLRGLHMRSFALDSSATWYKVSYAQNNNGSVTAALMIGLQAGRVAPVETQDGDAFIYSDIIGA